jgi:hypothetical protein
MRFLDKIVLFGYNDIMSLFSKQKWLYLMLAVHLGFSIMGTFIFALTESFPEVDLAEDELTPGSIFASIDYTSDCLTGSGSLIGKARRHSFSVARNGFLRITSSAELKNSEMFFSRLSLRTIEETNHLSKKKSILLKLRI